MGEVVRLLASEGNLTGAWERTDWKFSVPQGVREVISRRLDVLSQECDRVLSVASVIGREFVTNVLEQAADMPRDRLLEILEEAVANRLIAEAPRVPGRYSFSHALIRETLYEELSVTRRVELHGRIGETLERLHAANPEPHAAELAHHFCQAVRGGGDAEKAISYATRAGAHAMRQLAYEDAADREKCDDGNLINGDGCDSNCRVTRCGNGIVTAGEQCDPPGTRAQARRATPTPDVSASPATAVPSSH